MLNNNFSDYGSGSSSSWMSQQDVRWPPFRPTQTMERTQKSSSYSDLVNGRCTLEDVMRDFHMNGSDSPYDPDEDRVWGKRSPKPDQLLSGMGPPSAYLRQKSWPAPERSPAPPLPRAEHFATSTPVFATSTPVFDALQPSASPPALDAISPEQARVLASLPAAVLYALLRQLQRQIRPRTFQECRFCKNNGERESYYRAHVLKDGAGRVACPVLRAFRCARCGASGDRAHTIKYCPLSTNEERIKSAAMMRSVRMASGRRRAGALQPSMSRTADYVVFGAPTESVVQDNNAYNYGEAAPLDPLWAAVEQKLLL